MSVIDATYQSDYHQHQAETDPDGLCWKFFDRTWTWEQAWDDSRRLAGALAAAGIGRGDRIATLNKNNPATLITTQASCLLGCVNTIVNWRLAGDALDYVLNDSGARVLLIGPEFLAHLDLICDKLTSIEKVIVVGGQADEFDALLEASEPVDRANGVEPSDACMLMYSSGTTGRPKPVMLTQHNMVAHTQNSGGDFDPEPGDMMMIAMPMFHVGQPRSSTGCQHLDPSAC